MMSKLFSVFAGSAKGSIKDILPGLKLIGSLYRKIIGSKKEEIAEECVISMSISNEKTFDYLLNVESDEWDNKKYFALTNDRGIKHCYEKGKETLIWEQDKAFFIFTILNDSENSKNKEEFLKVLATLICSYDYAVDIPQADKEETKSDYITKLDELDDIDAFLEENYSKIYGALPEEKINVDNIANDFGKMKINQLYFKKSYPNANLLFSNKGVLFKYDAEKDDLIKISNEAIFQIFKINNFKYFLVVDNAKEEETLTCTGISQENNIIPNKQENLIMWLSKENQNEFNAYNFAFSDESKFDELRQLLTKIKYESSSLSKYEDLNADDRDWLENENIPDEVPDDDKMNDIEMEFDNAFQESTSELSNKVTTQAYLHDRTFVVRENNAIGVYKTDEDDVLTHLANLPPVNVYEDKDINIKNTQMFLSDTNMLLLDTKNPNCAYRFDLGKGKIVEEWKAEDMKKIEALAPENKFGQMTDNPLVIGVNNNTLFTMDSRINKKNKVVQTKAYKTNPKMNCIMTTGTGGIAVGSLNGEIRLYKEVGKNAKTLLPCFGDPIKSIDASSDGRYLLATCDKYLLLIPTTCKGDQTGFNVQMGKEKPHPKTLKIKPIDINKYKMENLNFTPARFNVNQTTGETNIITSLGDYVVDWNFGKIKKGIFDDYKIKRVNQKVLENQFKFNRNQIVVTMENKLRIQNQKQLFTDDK